jgi:hypothetical protein
MPQSALQVQSVAFETAHERRKGTLNLSISNVSMTNTLKENENEKKI